MANSTAPTWGDSGPQRLFATGGSARTPIHNPGEAGPRPRGGGNQMPVQAPVTGQDGWFSCSMHEIRYRQELPGGCPMCRQARQLVEVGKEVQKLKNAIKLLQRDKDNLKAQISHVDAMRVAQEVMEDDDRLAIKGFLYRWRRGEKVDAAIRKEDFTSDFGAGVRHMVAGFRVGSEVHYCSSVGGVAMARAFNDATKLVGRDEATAAMSKVMGLAPPGEDRE